MSETKEKTIPTSPDILSSLEKKADSPEKESYDLQIVAPLIGNIFYNLNYTEVRLDEKLKQPFEVITSNQNSQNFPRHLFYDRGENGSQKISNVEQEKLPVFKIKIKIGNSFNIIRDLPNLIKKVQEEHNSKMDEYDLTDPMMFIDTSTQLKDYWQFMAKKLIIFWNLQDMNLKK